MKVNVLSEHGYDEAILGLSLSYNIAISDAETVALTLAPKGKGHNKFLESICIWLDIDAPRSWWQQFDTYRTGMTKQSESTMHTLLRRELTIYDFDSEEISPVSIEEVNKRIRAKNFLGAKDNLPESFLQRRVACTNYKALRNIYSQRLTHRIHQWQQFISDTYKHLQHKEFLDDILTSLHRS
jgi:hypothetical protein